MDPRRALITLAAVPLLLLPLACAGSVEDETADPEAREAAASLEGRRIDLFVPPDHASADGVSDLVSYLESQADVAQARASVRRESEAEGAEVSVELWGRDMPSDEELAGVVQEQFPHVTAVVVSSLDDAIAPGPGDAENTEHDDPEALRQEIIDDLREQGVAGDIDVQITSHPDGRREVEVNVLDDEPPA